jgi:hypothetical protein
VSARRQPGTAVLARRLVLAGALAGVIAEGCSVPALAGAGYVGPKNSCDETCTEGTCVNGACVAAKGSYPFFLEITPPTTASFAAGTTFAYCSADSSSGVRNLDLPAPAVVSARIDAAGVTCTAGKPLGVSLRLERTGALPGAAPAIYEARGTPTDATPEGVTLRVPPGMYDVYVAPTDPCVIAELPPYPIGTRSFGAGTQKLDVVYATGLPQFQLTLLDETGASLATGTSADAKEARDLVLIDGTTGLPVSTTVNTCEHVGSATLTLAPAVARAPNDPLAHAYVLRVSPAKASCHGVTPPSVQPWYDVDFAGLSVDGSSAGTISVQRATHVSPERAFGDVRAVVTSSPVAASIVLRSTALDMPAGAKLGTPYYVVDTASDATSGKYFLEAPPGTYRALVVPDMSSAYSVWAADVVLSKGTPITAIQMPLKTPVQGLVAAPDGTAFTLGSVDGLAIDDASTGALPKRSRSAALTAPTANNFSLSLDRGTFDLVARVPVASGYPWMLVPSIDVPQRTTATPSLQVGTLSPSAPVRLSGVVRDPNRTPIAHAWVRARAVLVGTGGKSDASTCSFTNARAVAVGETQTGDDGSYTLLLPADVTKVHATGS